MGCFVAGSIAAISAIMTPAVANAAAVSDNWFSITSLLLHDEAFDGAHDVELSGDLAFVPGKGGSIAIVNVADPKRPRIVASVPFSDVRGPNGLTVKVQTYSTSTGNSGIQLRCRYDAEADKLDGHQVDVDPPAPWRCGLICDSTRGAGVWVCPDVGKAKNLKPEHATKGWTWKHADDGDAWNDTRIICKGLNIKTIVNGVTISDYDGTGRLDDKFHRLRNLGVKGHIGLQIHGGAGTLLIRFKDIRIKPLK